MYSFCFAIIDSCIGYLSIFNQRFHKYIKYLQKARN